jgi:hypothetical protein
MANKADGDRGSYIMSNYEGERDGDPLHGHRGGCMTLVVSVLTFILLLYIIVV